MTDKEKEAIEILFHLEHINGYVDLYEKNDVIIKSDILLKWKNATKEVLNLIQTQQAEIEKLKNNNKDLLRKLRNRVKEVKKLTKYSLYKKEFSTLNEHLKKKDKIIDLMAEELTTPLHSKEWVKDYYERKVENGN